MENLYTEARISPLIPHAEIEVNPAAICENFRAISRYVGPRCQVWPVVKAEAYRCGAEEVAKTLQNEGAKRFCVSHLEEARELREAGIVAEILVMIPLLPENLSYTKDLRCEIVIDSVERAEQASYQAPLTAHIKVNTGLNRLGCDPHQASGLALRSQELGLNVTGLMTHFAPGGSVNASYAKFMAAAEAVEDILKRPVLKHTCGSYGLLSSKQAHLDAVRPGTLLYGQWPAGAGQPTDLKISQDVWHLVSRLVAIRDITAGEAFGYGQDKVKGATRIGVVPVGPADGATMIPISLVKGFFRWFRRSRRRETATWRPREPGGKAVQVPIVGRASMQMLFVDLSLHPAAQIGDEVEIPCRRLAANPQLIGKLRQ